MTIAPKAFQNPEEVLNWLVLLLLFGSFIYLGAWAVAHAFFHGRFGRAPLEGARLRPARAVRWRTPLPVLGFLIAFAPSTTAKGRSAVIPSRRDGRAAAPPWSETSGFPPPRPLVRIRAFARSASGAASPTESSAERDRSQLDDGPRTSTSSHTAHPSPGPDGRPAAPRHPAVHPDDAGATVTPLFPRARRYETRKDADRAERERAMDRHPARGNSKGGPVAERYVVRRGDTLWDIAARLLDTDDVARVARYWPRIHRSNRDVIGPDPSLILPGMVLELPDEWPA